MIWQENPHNEQMHGECVFQFESHIYRGLNTDAFNCNLPLNDLGSYNLSNDQNEK